MAPWDVASEYILMSGSPNLLSTGGRCLHGGFSHVWIRRRFPILFTECMRYMIIFDLDGVLPVYKAGLEQPNKMLGTFDLYRNAFRECAGIYINRMGKIELDVPPIPEFMHKYGDLACPATKQAAQDILRRVDSNRHQWITTHGRGCGSQWTSVHGYPRSLEAHNAFWHRGNCQRTWTKTN